MLKEPEQTRTPQESRDEHQVKSGCFLEQPGHQSVGHQPKLSQMKTSHAIHIETRNKWI